MINPIFFTKVTEEGSYGKFVIEPLHRGFGQSVGHSLRRTLLSSLKGASITNVKLEGVTHLFSSLPGVKESALEVVLNLKQIKFDIKEPGQYKIKINAKGSGKIYSKDIEGEITPIDPEIYIAEITDDKKKLVVDAIVEVGIGYSPVDERETKEYGYIPVEASFSPVEKVRFEVSEARVGRKVNFERLILEVWTDGSVKPTEAVKESTMLLSKYFTHFFSGSDSPETKTTKSVEEEKQEAIDKKLYEIIIDELNLPSRVINALLRERIETVADLIKAGREKLIGMKGVGKKSIQLIEDELKKMDISLS